MAGQSKTSASAFDAARRLRLQILVVVTPVLALGALITVLSWDLARLAPYEIPLSAMQWMPGPSYRAPRRLAEGERIRPVAALPRNALGPIQVTALLPGVAPGRGPDALLALSLSGEAAAYVNGIPARNHEPVAQNYLTSPRAGPRLFLFPSAFHHPDRSRYDLLFAAPRGRPLAASLYAGPRVVLRPIADRIAAWTAFSRTGLSLLGAVVTVLCLGAAWARRASLFWLSASAFAAAVSARAWIGSTMNVATLGQLWPAVDLGLIGAATVCLAMTAWRAHEAWSGRAARTVAAALQALAGVAMAAAVWGALQLFSGVWLVRSELAYGLGAGIALAIAGGTAAVLLGRAAVMFARTQLDLSRLVRTQREEIATKSQALEQEMRRSAILEERQRLARDMHDGIGGQLVSLIARVRSRRVDIAQVERDLVDGLAELRLVVDSLDTTGDTLAEALGVFRSRAQPQAEAAGITLVWTQTGDLDVRAEDPRWVLNVYRLLQEAISNAVAHSGGDRLEVTLAGDGEGGLTITVIDNGKGLAGKDAGRRKGGGRGLSNMAYRANQLGGDLELGNGEGGAGTRIAVRLPMPERRGRSHQSSGEISPS